VGAAAGVRHGAPAPDHRDDYSTGSRQIADGFIPIAELTGSMSVHMVSQVPKYVGLDATFGALADPTRRGILELASTGPASISDLARPFGIALPTVLEHVRILEETRLLTTEKVGRVRECTIGPERLDEARQWIETFRMWERRLDGLDRYISTRPGRRG
jgi:DNA-binding transcriptional ArsR family regulator